MWHILSIGHDPLLLETRKLLLEVFGCAVTTATSMDEAVAACGSQHFDAAILCHTLKADEIDAAYQRLRTCIPAMHVVRLHQYDDVSYDPLTFVHRVQSAASSIRGAA